MAETLSDIMGIKDPFAQNVLKASKAKGEVEAAEKQEKVYGQQELAKAEAETTKKFAEEREPKELKEKYEKTVDELGKPFIPTQQTAGDLGTIFAMTNILGFLIGGGAKGSAQAALSAQNGMLEGYQKGQQDIYKKQKDIFDENQKALSKAVEGLRDELKRAAETASVNKELGLAQARQAIANHQAKQMGEYLDKMGVAATYELSEKAWQINEKLKAEKRAEEDRAEKRAHDRKMEQGTLTPFVVTENGKQVTKLFNNRTGEITLAKDNLAGATKVGAKEPGEKSLKKGEYQAKFVSDIIGEPVDVDTASKAVAGTQYKQKLKDLQEMNTTLGGVPGLKVDFADYINKAIATKAGPDGKFSKEDLDAAYEELKTDPKLSKSFSALSDDSKVMAKAELDAVMQNLQTKYGNRAPVAEFRATQSVLSRKNMSASSYNRVLANEIQATDDRLKGLGLKPTAVIALERHFAKHPNEVSLVQSIPEDTQSSVDTTTGYPPTNSSGWVLHRDSHGNYGYVSPDGQQVEELE